MDIRNRIIEGAAELFRTYGIKLVTMDSLASHLGISKRTIYEVFADKDELVIGVLQTMADKQKELIAKIIGESENSIIAIFRIMEISSNHVQSMSPAFKEDIKKFHIEILMKKTVKCEMPDYSNNTEIIIKGINEGLFRKDINPDLVNRCLWSLGKSLMDFELYPYELFSRREVVRNVYINYLRGVSTPAGIEQINTLMTNF
jgi:TetR/AcrR family transcriptional regulator, cholesterol catabolism regulator